MTDIYDKNEHRCSGGRNCRLNKELKALACAAEYIADQVTGPFLRSMGMIMVLIMLLE